jgi:hypothetical protein
MRAFFALFLAAGSLLATEGARVFYSKAFPGSIPAYVSIEIEKDGSAVYKEAPDDEAPIRFKLGEAETNQIFALAAKLDNFKRELEAPVKVANMGMKTFRIENGADKHEVKFNYTQDLDAQALHDLFERLTETQQLFFTLERTVKFDKLGVNKSLLQFQAAMDRNRVIGPDRFLPLLDRVAKNESYLHMARERAAGLADVIRNPRPKQKTE